MVHAGYAVVDVETTGLFTGRWHNRIVEVGVVHLDRDGVPTDEWCTLLNPERDLGPQHVHGIQAADVLSAPRFADIAGDLGARLAGRVVVAHNLAFDLRFLRYEFERLGYPVPLAVDFGLCTMALAERYLHSPSRSLAACCAAVGVRQTAAHSALDDARSAGALLGHVLRRAGRPEPWRALFDGVPAWPWLPPGDGRTRQRGASDSRPRSFLARLVDRLPHEPSVPHADEYLDLLDRALLDRHLSVSEQDALLEVAESLGLGLDTAMALHRRYLAAIARVAWQDGVLSDAEHADLALVANLLGLTAQDVDAALAGARDQTEPRSWGRFRLEPGDTVAFTGQLTDPREEWEHRAVTVGLTVTGGGVTRRTRLLVAADPDSLSGKAGKARQYGIPIVTEDAFAAPLDQLAAQRDVSAAAGGGTL